MSAATDESRMDLVSRAQRFGAQALVDEVAEILVARHAAELEGLERVRSYFAAGDASVAPFSEMLRRRLRAHAVEDLIADFTRLVLELELELPESFSRIETAEAPKGLHMRRARGAPATEDKP